MKKRTKIRCAVATGILLAAYTVSYICLSANGRFEPGSIGLNGVKGYEWAPKGFVHDFKWNNAARYFYLPLWDADIQLWHNDSHSGKYPLNEVPPEEIWKVYKAWSH